MYERQSVWHRVSDEVMIDRQSRNNSGLVNSTKGHLRIACIRAWRKEGRRRSRASCLAYRISSSSTQTALCRAASVYQGVSTVKC